METTDLVNIFRGLSLFDAVLLYRRALLGESYVAIGKRIGYSYEYIRNRYSDITTRLRGKLENDHRSF